MHRCDYYDTFGMRFDYVQVSTAVRYRHNHFQMFFVVHVCLSFCPFACAHVMHNRRCTEYVAREPVVARSVRGVRDIQSQLLSGTDSIFVLHVSRHPVRDSCVILL